LPGPQLSLTTPIEEQLVLRTVEGAVDLLAGELDKLASVTILRPLTSSVSIHISGELQGLYNCPLYSSAAIPLHGDPGDKSFLEPLRASTAYGVLAALNQPVAFRAPRSLASTVTREFGWRNEPGGWNVNVTESASAWIAEVGPLYWTRRFGRLERLPWSTNPVVAEVVVRLAKIRPGHRVLDPFCGSGTLLLAARRRAGDIEILGSDHVAASVEVARRNLAGASSQLSTAAAEEIQQDDRSIDRVVANLPFGKRVGSHQDNLRLYPRALAEIARVLTDDGRSVLLTEDKRLLRDAVARTRGLKIVRERVLRFNGATPTAFVLAPNRSRRTTTAPTQPRTGACAPPQVQVAPQYPPGR
jgi:tRNA (guanine6-N2)-methyltransferase